MTRGRRTRVAKGIYRDNYGLAVVVTVGRLSKERRFPFGTSFEDLKREQQQLRSELLDTDDRPVHGSLAAAAPRYLALVKYLATSTWRGRKCEIDAWVDYCGPTLLGQLTKETVLRARNHWIAEGVAAKTINNRVGALRHLYHTLGRKKGRTPCDDVPALAVVQQPAAVVDADTVSRVAKTLVARVRAKEEKPETLARFLVLTATGVRPSELGRAEPGDVDLERGAWRVRTGKGGFRTPMPLNADMIAAWRYFVSVNAWSPQNTEGQRVPFDVSTYDKRLYEAGWPRAIRPYQVRHTFGWDLSEEGVDLSDIQELLGHRNIKTTRTHYVAPIVKRLAEATKRLDHRFGYSALKLPGVPRTGAKIRGAGRRKSAKSGGNRREVKSRNSGA